MTYVAGSSVRSAVLRRSYPLIGLARTDISVNQTIDWEPVPGLSVVCEPQTAYAVDGYIAFDAGTTPDISIGFLAPPFAAGSWALACMGPAVSGSSGIVNMLSTTEFTTAAIGHTGGSAVNGLNGRLRATLTTSRVGGSFQTIFTQNVADAAAITVKAGSWVRLTRMSDA